MPGTAIPIASGTGDEQGVVAAYNLVLVGYSVAESASSAAAAEVILRHGTSNSAPLLAAPINLDANGYGHFPTDIMAAAGIWIERVSGETTVVLYVKKI